MGQVSEFDLDKFRTIVSKLIPFLSDKEARILEIGCSTGALLSLLKGLGYPNILGVDPSPACREIAQNLYGIRLLTSTLSNMVIKDQSVDVLILVGVLEHVRDLNSALVKCHKMLKDTGLVYISVPDASRYAEGEDAPFQEFSLEHINFLGPLSLTNLMRFNGFEVVLSEQTPVNTNFHTSTPVIHGIYRISKSLPVFTPDTQTQTGLETYITQSHAAENRIHRIISEITSSGQPIIVWGTGAHTLRLLAVTRLREANIRAFVDSNPNYQGKDLFRIPIIAPKEINKDSGGILVSSRVYQHEIVEQIRTELQLNNQIITLYPLD